VKLDVRERRLGNVNFLSVSCVDNFIIRLLQSVMLAYPDIFGLGCNYQIVRAPVCVTSV
jgi:hypothetical protein